MLQSFNRSVNPVKLNDVLFIGSFTILNKYRGTISISKLLNKEDISQFNLTVMAIDDATLVGGYSLNSTVSREVSIVCNTLSSFSSNLNKLQHLICSLCF